MVHQHRQQRKRQSGSLRHKHTDRQGLLAAGNHSRATIRFFEFKYTAQHPYNSHCGNVQPNAANPDRQEFSVTQTFTKIVLCEIHASFET